MKAAAAIAMAMLAAAVPFSVAQSGATSTAKQPKVSFQMERAGVAVPQFTLEIHEDGTGNYHAEQVESLAGSDTVHYAKAENVDRTLNLTPSTAAEIFKLARVLNHFQMQCASTKKNIANTGKKTLSYTGADGTGSCVYNYSDNKDVTALTNIFLGIAFTLDEGRRLDFLHQYDRLGLDAETISLQEAAKSGRARELGIIAPTLNSIVQDPAVMERVRRRSADMLKRAGSGEGNRF